VLKGNTKTDAGPELHDIINDLHGNFFDAALQRAWNKKMCINGAVSVVFF